MTRGAGESGVNGCEVERETLCAEPEGGACRVAVLALCEGERVGEEGAVEEGDVFCVVCRLSHCGVYVASSGLVYHQ